MASQNQPFKAWFRLHFHPRAVWPDEEGRHIWSWRLHVLTGVHGHPGAKTDWAGEPGLGPPLVRDPKGRTEFLDLEMMARSGLIAGELVFKEKCHFWGAPLVGGEGQELRRWEGLRSRRRRTNGSGWSLWTTGRCEKAVLSGTVSTAGEDPANFEPRWNSGQCHLHGAILGGAQSMVLKLLQMKVPGEL